MNEVYAEMNSIQEELAKINAQGSDYAGISKDSVANLSTAIENCEAEVQTIAALSEKLNGYITQLKGIVARIKELIN